MQNEFQNTLYRSKDQMLAAIAYEWMTAGGGHSDEEVTRLLAINSDPAALADECVGGWDLNAEWLAERDISRANLVEAFAEFISERPDIDHESLD
jgi:hypothetical protein